MKQLVWLDLCSGLGGASQPALDRGWKVIRVDIDPRFKPDIVADVRHIGDEFDNDPVLPRPDVLWASPPCRDFVVAAMGYLLRNPRDPKTGRFYYKGDSPRLGDNNPDTSISWAIRRIVKEIGPKWWCVENVWSSRKWLTPIFGPVAAKVPGHVFWGRLPCLLPDTKSHKSWKDWSKGKFADRAAERAKIPYEIGEAICAAVETRQMAENV